MFTKWFKLPEGTRKYISKRLQSSFSTSCGAYCILFIHIILLCDYNLNIFADIISQIFPKSNSYIENDKILFKYILQSTQMSSKDCKKYFCNSSFAIKYNKCLKLVCNKYGNSTHSRIYKRKHNTLAESGK